MNNASTQTSIVTFSGRKFDPLAPCADDVSLEDIAHALSRQCRFNGHVLTFYSIAQHSVLVASLVPEHLRLQALLHDAAEAYLGDMVSPLKALFPEFSPLEDRVLGVIGEKLGVSFRLSELERAQIKRADLIALATEKRDLIKGNREIWECLWGVVAHPSLIKPMAPEAAEHAFLESYKRFAEQPAALARAA